VCAGPVVIVRKTGDWITDPTVIFHLARLDRACSASSFSACWIGRRGLQVVEDLQELNSQRGQVLLDRIPDSVAIYFVILVNDEVS
jgi:hypothetical protein